MAGGGCVSLWLIWQGTEDYLLSTRVSGKNETLAEIVRRLPHCEAIADARWTRGLVVFDLETTQLIEDSVDIEEMDISCACAAWVPWHRARRR